MKMFLMAIAFIFGTLGCTTKKIQNTEAPRQFLFPQGLYRHNVHLEIQKEPQKEPQKTETRDRQKFSFNGVVTISEQTIKIVGFSPFGTTLFRMSEDQKSGRVETQVYIDALKPMESRMAEYYVVLKKLLTIKHSGNPRPQQIILQTPAGETPVHFKHYDQNGVPDEIDVQNSKFSIQIKVSGYEI